MAATLGRVALVTAATVPAVSVEDARRHCRLVDTDDDRYLETLVSLAQTYLERVYGVYLPTQTLDITYDGSPGWSGSIPLPCTPVASITSITTYDTADASAVVASTVYRLDATSRPNMLVLKADQSWPTGLRSVGAYVVRAVVGYGVTTASMPMPLVQAVLLLVAHWYEQRQIARDGTDMSGTNPLGLDALLSPYRLGTGF